MSKKVVVLLSGGLDSTVLLAKTVHLGYDAVPVNILYGQKHSREREAARLVAAHYSLELRTIDLPLNLYRFKPLALIEDSGVDVPDREYDPNGEFVTEVPFRNGIFLSIAVAVAMQVGAETVVYAAHKDDRTGDVYRDCTPEFVEAFELAAIIGGGVAVTAPFSDKTKSDIVLSGEYWFAPMHLSYSCYKGLEKHCGVCPTCLQRKAAFEQANFPDPTEYAK